MVFAEWTAILVLSVFERGSMYNTPSVGCLITHEEQRVKRFIKFLSGSGLGTGSGPGPGSLQSPGSGHGNGFL